jgi:glycosyltransferase involved in cell wall biosynthesis
MATFLVDNPSPPTHVLMIAYIYPPNRIVTGSRRIIKFAKYLPHFGYRPVVLTTRAHGTLPDDTGSSIFRADDPVRLLKHLYQLVKRANQSPTQPVAVSSTAPGPESRIQQWRAKYSIPDQQIIWYPWAVWTARSLLRSLPIRLLYSTSTPETDHLVGLTLKRLTGLPWVVDFRDGWMFETIPFRHTSPLRHAIESRLERAVVTNADHIITASQVLANDFRQRYPRIAPRISVITNGYDPDDFAPIQREKQKTPTFRVVHTGTFSLGRWNTSLDGLLEALRSMQADQLPLMEDLEIVLVGDLTATEWRTIEQSGVQEHFSMRGRVPYHEALEYQVQADILLLIVTAQVTSHSANKFFEYLATGRPILALASQSSIVGVVSHLGAGLVVDPDDPVGIRRALQTFHAQWKAGLLPTRVREQVRQFDRRELTRNLAAIFDRLLEPGGS